MNHLPELSENGEVPDEKLTKTRPHAPLKVTHPHLQGFMSFLPELNKESDRGAFLVSCSYLDELLGNILVAFLIERKGSTALVEGFNAPLGTFSTRASAAVALGLITAEEFQECETLRRIRNRFAHDIHASFAMPAIRDLGKNLTYSAKPYDEVKVDARGECVSAAVGLIMDLTNRPAYVEKHRRKEQHWPY